MTSARLPEVREIVRLMRADLWDGGRGRQAQLPIDRTFPLDKVVDALAMMKASQHFGRSC